MAGPDLVSILTEQQAYYDARASEYDDKFARVGRHDLGPELNAHWDAELAELRAALADAKLIGRILEPAAGTGVWTAHLATTANEVLALDASTAMLERNQARLASVGLADRVRYARADLFAWRPDQTYDAVFLGFWLSHVPDERLDTFLATIAQALQTGGTLFLADNRRRPEATPADPIQTRHLNDGRAFQMVDIYRSPATLERVFAGHGLALQVRETAMFFQFGAGEKR